MEARMAMMAITTSNSMRVKPECGRPTKGVRRGIVRPVKAKRSAIVNAGGVAVG
jgi:hypothetical protein